MKSSVFAGLANKYGTDVKPFSQSVFRQKYMPGFPYALCSAMVDGWVRSKQRGTDLFMDLSAPTDDLLKSIADRQLNSYYPIVSLPDFNQLGESDAGLLKEKYKIGSAAELLLQVNQRGATDLLSYDLLIFFDLQHSRVYGFEEVNDQFIQTLIPLNKPAGVFIQILVIRYKIKKDGQYVKRSHRMAIYYHDGTWDFFDPNAGSVHFNADSKIANWFKQFWALSSYSKLGSVAGFNLITVYTLY